MDAFKREFKKEVKHFEETNHVTEISESIIKTSIFKRANILTIKTSKNKKVEKILKNKFQNNYIIRSLSGEVICIKEKNKNQEAKILSKILRSQ